MKLHKSGVVIFCRFVFVRYLKIQFKIKINLINSTFGINMMF